ncbi:hypothetical protein [Halobacillus sp. Cin3]|uniref:hypothetical protein n=1 Tax=Halobacillus sp. Cin3 TaxID=2928441 RepID=UPI00248EDFEC|nr:hypothetical protein [Halobacillus sp. Cin3]
MKRSLGLLLITLSIITLSACGSDSTKSAEAKDTEAAEQKDVGEHSKRGTSHDDAEEPVVEDVSLLGAEVGQVYHTPDFEKLTVNKRTEPEQHIEVGPLKINIGTMVITTIEGVKDEWLNETMENYYGYNMNEPLTFLSLDYTVENTTNQDLLSYYPIHTIILSTGEQIEVPDKDFFEDSPEWEYYGNAFQTDLSLGIGMKSDIEDITSIRIITDGVYDMDNNEIKSPVEAKIDFK